LLSSANILLEKKKQSKDVHFEFRLGLRIFSLGYFVVFFNPFLKT
jgi:hypothetical protein